MRWFVAGPQVLLLARQFRGKRMTLNLLRGRLRQQRFFGCAFTTVVVVCCVVAQCAAPRAGAWM